jgi:predicted ribosomally synthesized peptide with nif11-like leader
MMSELDRLLGDLQQDRALFDEFQGLGNDVEAWARWANAKGYQFTADEARELADSYSGEIAEDDLEKVAGGWCGNEATIG